MLQGFETMDDKVCGGVHFLLVEDDDAHAMMIEVAFESSRHAESCSLTRVRTGQEALDLMNDTLDGSNHDRPDVVLLDLKLPGLDGFDVLKHLKSDESTKHIPVVMISTSDAETDQQRALRLHANSYVVKPVGFELFCERIEQIFNYWQSCQHRPVVQEICTSESIPPKRLPRILSLV